MSESKRYRTCELGELEDLIHKTAHMTELAKLAFQEVAFIGPALPDPTLSRQQCELVSFALLEAESYAHMAREAFRRL